MAKKKKKRARVNKSQAIREYLEANRKASANEIVAALKDQGLSVTEALVYNVRNRMGLGVRHKKRVRERKRMAPQPKKRAAPVGSSQDLDFTTLKEAKQLADSLGGIERAKHALDALSELQ